MSVIGLNHFKNMRVLDVGCGEGGFCLDLFRHSEAKMVLGIDLDSRLIKVALSHLSTSSANQERNSVQESALSTLAELKNMPISFNSLLAKAGLDKNRKFMHQINPPPKAHFSSNSKNRLMEELSTPRSVPKLSFEVANFLAKRPQLETGEKFDIVTCFSFTK